MAWGMDSDPGTSLVNVDGRVFVTGASEASRYNTDYATIACQG